MLFLVLSDFAAYAHALAEDVDEAVVYLVYLLAESCDVFCCLCLFADDEYGEDEVEDVGCDLLAGVAPCLLRVAVALDDESVHAEVHGLLAGGGDEVASSANVAWVVDDG